MRILGSICARGGSKGVKNKNIRLLNGKPLMTYTIDNFKAWRKADRIICSTDSTEIQEIAIKNGVEAPFLRPKHLATDTSSKVNVFKHLLKYCEEEENKKYDYLIDLDVTSPLRTVKDVDNAFNKLINSDADLICSCYKAERNPYFNMMEVDEKGYAHLSKKPKENIHARQLAPPVYSLNASIYIYRRDFLVSTDFPYSGKTILYEMSDYSVDIDRQIDFAFVEYLIKEEKFKFDY